MFPQNCSTKIRNNGVRDADISMEILTSEFVGTGVDGFSFQELDRGATGSSGR